MKRIYFDNAATTAVDERVISEMLPYFNEEFGNPSSIYELGQDNKKVITKARKQVAGIINAQPDEIYFTSGGSESDNWAISGAALMRKNTGKHIITSQIEHHAVSHTCEYLEKRHGFKISYVEVDNQGILNLDSLKRALDEETTLVTIMLANNEIGTIQPVKQAVEIIKSYNNAILVHTDAVQCLGNIEIDVKDLGVDLLSLSAHKVYGPKGTGALYIRKGVAIDNLIHGGGQEKKKRAGTENVPGIVGFGKACELLKDGFEARNSRISAIRDRIFDRLTSEIEDVRINGSREQRLPGNANVSIKFVEGEALLLSLDIAGIMSSSGSACTSGSLDPSHVLLAIGLDHETAHGSLRFSIGKNNTMEEADRLADKLKEIVKNLRAMSPLTRR